MFVTLFCGVLETETGQFSFANAGHNPPLLLDAQGGCEFLPVRKGLVAGIMEASRYLPDTRQLAPGESLLLYTDGVTEALNPAQELYSEARFLECVRQSGCLESPRRVVDAVRTSIAAFSQSAPQADDITMLAVRYHGTGAPAVPPAAQPMPPA